MSLDAMKQALEALEAWNYLENPKPDANVIAALRAAIEQAQDPETELETYKRLYELRGKALERPCSNCGHQPAKIKATAQTGSAQSGLAEKIPAKGTLLEQTLKDVWDEMPHTALMDAIIGGTGVMLGDKRIDPASIYKQPEQEPVAWVCYGSASDEKHTIDYQQEDIDAIPVGTMLYTAPRQWQGLTEKERTQFKRLGLVGVEIIEAKLKERNT